MYVVRIINDLLYGMYVHVCSHVLCSHNAGHSLYTEWSAKWQVDANTLPNVKFYVTDEFLPYWVQCTQEGCGKWRRLPFGVELCRVDQNSIRCIDCSKPEEKVRTYVCCGACHWYSEFSTTATALSTKSFNPPQFPSTNIIYKYVRIYQ